MKKGLARWFRIATGAVIHPDRMPIPKDAPLRQTTEEVYRAYVWRPRIIGSWKAITYAATLHCMADIIF